MPSQYLTIKIRVAGSLIHDKNFIFDCEQAARDKVYEMIAQRKEEENAGGKPRVPVGYGPHRPRKQPRAAD
jgi:hypothetical protein